jgi:hypothetical protein
MKEVLFYMLPVLEFDEGKSLHLSHVLTSFLYEEEAIENFYTNHLEDYKETYTAGHYGDPNYKWIFSHHEIYSPMDLQLPSMVILRYRPLNSTDSSTGDSEE